MENLIEYSTIIIAGLLLFFTTTGTEFIREKSDREKRKKGLKVILLIKRWRWRLWIIVILTLILVASQIYIFDYSEKIEREYQAKLHDQDSIYQKTIIDSIQLANERNIITFTNALQNYNLSYDSATNAVFSTIRDSLRQPLVPFITICGNDLEDFKISKDSIFFRYPLCNNSLDAHAYDIKIVYDVIYKWTDEPKFHYSSERLPYINSVAAGAGRLCEFSVTVGIDPRVYIDTLIVLFHGVYSNYNNSLKDISFNACKIIDFEKKIWLNYDYSFNPKLLQFLRDNNLEIYAPD